MTTSRRAVTADSLGAWLVKWSDDVHPVATLIRTDFSTVTSPCVRQTYRTDLVRRRQPVLFWISGSSKLHPAGIYAQGHTTGPAVARGADETSSDPAGRGQSQLVMPVRLRSLQAPVLRRDLVQHPTLARIEVLRMAAGSNPSFVTPADLAALRARWPQVTVS